MKIYGANVFAIVLVTVAISAYYGVWKMKRNWMYFFVFLLIIATMTRSFGIFSYDLTTVFNASVNVILNIIVICWLLLKRKLFNAS